MTTVLLIIHLFVTLALIGVVLIQRSEGGGLGVGTSQGMGSFMSGRGTANLLTRTTSILAAVFFSLSLVLALLNRGTTVRHSILDVPAPASSGVPAAPGGIVPGGAPSVPTALPPAASTPAPASPPPSASTPAPAAPPSGAPPVPTN